MRKKEDITAAAQKRWADREFINQVVEQADAAHLREIVEHAGFRVGGDGRLIAKRGNCDGCGGYRLLHRAVGGGRWLCPICWTDDLCET